MEASLSLIRLITICPLPLIMSTRITCFSRYRFSKSRSILIYSRTRAIEECTKVKPQRPPGTRKARESIFLREDLKHGNLLPCELCVDPCAPCGKKWLKFKDRFCLSCKKSHRTG